VASWSDWASNDEYAPIVEQFLSWYQPGQAQPTQTLSDPQPVVDKQGHPIEIFPSQYLPDISLGFGQTEPSGVGTEKGIDYAMPVGQQLYSPVAGTVVVEDKGKSDWGKRVMVKTADGHVFGIGHMSGFSVKAGQQIQAGTLLGVSGGDPKDASSGESTGPHIEVQWIDPSGKFLDPTSSGYIGKPISGRQVIQQHPVSRMLELAGWSYSQFLDGFNAGQFGSSTPPPVQDLGMVDSPQKEPLAP
jgi:murein DD-endopeptidase MepM/ murein hydrolase activator NlpD